MKPLTQSEFAQLIVALVALEGAFLQELRAESQQLGLGLFHHGALTWLWFDLNPQCPQLLRLEQPPFAAKKITPMLLFLRAHARGQPLTQVQTLAHGGRAGQLTFGRGELACDLEFRLFPHGQNLRARTSAQQLSWSRVKPLGAPQDALEATASPRSWSELSDEWRASRATVRPVASATPAELAKKLEHLLGRKQKALDEVRTALSDTTPWAELGEHLKAYGETDLPPNWRVLLDARQSRAANIERCFAKAKQQLRKEGGHRERLQALELECLHLQQLREQQDWEQIAKALAPQPTRTRVKASDAVRMRTLTSAHGFVFNWGKSARDNLQLLRAARPWDLWMHLRDYPGAHGLLRRERDQVVPRSDLEECARALLRHTLSTKTLARAGDKFDVLCVERRFVRPIKGDALGRVHYSNEQVLSIVLNP